ncbi:redoxin domain-containing protein [Natronomonas salina]|uniref:redoxin domain-containing protein n=1 Tax=Natronomonas salina TaxID=1710540 RepID=UPI0015B4F5BE|nr:redoxin domain-containing protein [Natronomonas salina]QLD89555.1 redoxin domain-containing protein [Natronomonas salina]
MEIGDQAPSFALPGTEGHETSLYTLDDHIASGVAILLFYPFDFSPICTTELCEFRDAEFLEFTPNVDVLAISTDSVYAHREFINRYDLPFPLLSDNSGDVSAEYGLKYDEYEQHEAVTQRALIVIDDTQEIVYTWTEDDASAEFDIAVLDDVRKNVDIFPSQN